MRRHPHDDVILVQVLVEGRHLALAEAVVERIVDVARGDAEPGRGLAVDGEEGLDAPVLLVGVDVDQLRLPFHLVCQPRRPQAEIGEVVALQRVLVAGIGAAATGADVLDRVEEKGGAGDLRQLGPEPRDHLLAAFLSLRPRFQVDEEEAAAGPAAAGEAHHGVDGGVAADDVDDLGQLSAHRLEGDALVGAEEAVELARVLLREEAFGHGVEQIDVEADDEEEDEEHQRAVVERPVQAPGIGADDELVAALEPAGDASLRPVGALRAE